MAGDEENRINSALMTYIEGEADLNGWRYCRHFFMAQGTYATIRSVDSAEETNKHWYI